MTGAVDRALAAWDGLAAPAWIVQLARACDASSQAKVAKRIGYSPATVSYVLQNRYPGDLAAVERSVKRALATAPVNCPVLGAIKGEDCLAHQREPFTPHNPTKVALYSACRSCVNAAKNQEKRRA